MKHGFLLLMGFAAGGAIADPLPAPALLPDGHVAAVRRYLDTLDRAGFSGVVLVEYRGETVISDGYGYSDIAKGRRNTPQTVFDIGSITKQFTAAAIMKLEMEGKLSTEDSLSKFFRDVPPDKSCITLHHLLRHSSGLRSNIGDDYDSISTISFIDSVLHSPLRFPCGTAFSYSNIGYSLLAIIVERTSGLPYETYLYENLWRPAGMKNTGYRRPDFDRELIATGYHNDGREWGRPTEKR
jgi:CubicO group peptidase (beta-lactamase class C family)